MKLLRVTETSKFLAMSKSQVWKLTKDGVLKSYKLSDRVTVWKVEELENFIKSKIGV